jgi:hypothetical protein
MTTSEAQHRRRGAYRLGLLLCGGLCLPLLGSMALGRADRAEPTRAVVVGLHSSESTRGIAATHGAPEGGRYALVKLIDEKYRRDTYALVFVPPDIKVRRDDRVEIAASEFNLVAEPGRGVVVGLADDTPSAR